MTLKYSCTIEDYREANQALVRLNGKRAPWLTLAYLTPFIALPVLIARSRATYVPDLNNTGLDTWMLFIPAAIIPAVAAVFYLLSPFSPNRAIASSEKPKSITYWEPVARPVSKKKVWYRRSINPIVSILMVAVFFIFFSHLGGKDAPPFWFSTPFIAIYPTVLWIGVLVLINGLNRFPRFDPLRKLWNESPDAGTEIVVEWEDSFLTFTSINVSNKYRWEYIPYYFETENLLVLSVRARQVQMIPKRAFDAETDFFEFLAILGEKIGNGWIKKPPQIGFPITLSSAGEPTERPVVDSQITKR